MALKRNNPKNKKNLNTNMENIHHYDHVTNSKNIIVKILIILNLLLLIFLTSCFLHKINRLPNIPYYSELIASIENQSSSSKNQVKSKK
ncbi:hypothetical protein [Candidatus Phytoplasma prunorum]|uniref:hypothetical protein n=1 Tax=Candidatus Phytoplasma prunorum TaxID=47565 RepID=UPI002FF06C75